MMIVWRGLKRSAAAGAACAMVALAGCRSPWVQATVVNNEDAAISVVEVDYPGGSFGVQSIAAHATYHYRFHILANDSTSIEFNDAAKHSHTEKGPALHQGEAGTLRIEIGPDGKVAWTPLLTGRS